MQSSKTQTRIGWGLFLAGWTPLTGLTVVLLQGGGLSWLDAFLAGFPIGILFAFLAQSTGYLCRALPLAETGRTRLLATLLLGALITSAFWLLLGRGWLQVVHRWYDEPELFQSYSNQLPTLFVVGVAFYLLSVAIQYLAQAFEKSQEAERRALKLELLARQAELKALQFQINPHFLFNSLNSISALTRSDAAGARRMCLLLARFFRRSLSFGAQEKISLGRELELIRDYLDIEEIRFSTLQTEFDVQPQAEQCLVPSLLLQPLVENAVKHGITRLAEGGLMRLQAAVQSGRLSIRIDNPMDPELPVRAGTGLGLKTVEKRLENHYPQQAAFRILKQGGVFRVELSLPADLPEEASAQAEALSDLAEAKG